MYVYNYVSKGQTLEMSALTLFTVANLYHQLS